MTVVWLQLQTMVAVGCCFLFFPAAFCYLCPSHVFILFFVVYSMEAAVLSVVTGRNGGGDGGGATVALLLSLLLSGFLCLSFFSLLLPFPTVQMLLWTTGRRMAAGGGYADSNRWFFLLSLLLFFFLLIFFSNLLPLFSSHSSCSLFCFPFSPSCFGFFLLSKILLPLNMSFASLLLQNFAPSGFLFLPPPQCRSFPV